MDIQKEQIMILQKHLSSIRKIGGWTAEEFGKKIGVTKQTISNLENNKTPMSLTQYIAIRAVLDYEIQTKDNSTVLAQVVDVLLNRHDEFTSEEIDRISNNVVTVAATASGGVRGAGLANVFASLFNGIVKSPFVSIGIVGTSIWLSKLLKEDNEK